MKRWLYISALVWGIAVGAESKHSGSEDSRRPLRNAVDSVFEWWSPKVGYEQGTKVGDLLRTKNLGIQLHVSEGIADFVRSEHEGAKDLLQSATTPEQKEEAKETLDQWNQVQQLLTGGKTDLERVSESPQCKSAFAGKVRPLMIKALHPKYRDMQLAKYLGVLVPELLDPSKCQGIEKIQGRLTQRFLHVEPRVHRKLSGAIDKDDEDRARKVADQVYKMQRDLLRKFKRQEHSGSALPFGIVDRGEWEDFEWYVQKNAVRPFQDPLKGSMNSAAEKALAIYESVIPLPVVRPVARDWQKQIDEGGNPEFRTLFVILVPSFGFDRSEAARNQAWRMMGLPPGIPDRRRFEP